MFLVSGLACSGKTIINYLGYIIKRAKRLLIPMWSFGAVLITLLTIVALVFDKDLLTINYIIESFTMIGVIGYVWIMRVFLLVAMVTLLLIFVNNKVNCNLFIISLLCIWGRIDCALKSHLCRSSISRALC